MCICMRAGAQLWVERDRVANLQPLLQQSTGHIFVGFENQTINTADIVGGFSRLKDVYGERRKHIKACQVCLGGRRKGLVEVEGKKVYGRSLHRSPKGNSGTRFATGFIEMSLNKNHENI